MEGALYLENPYMKECEAQIISADADLGIICDRTVFFPAGGGQPGDVGEIIGAQGGIARISDSRYTAERDSIRHIINTESGAPNPFAPDEKVKIRLSWEHRFRLMRIHTALHLLTVALPFPVTGGQMSPQEGRLDFNIPQMPFDKNILAERVNALISQDLEVTSLWITDDELAANPGLVKTMSVKPPMGSGRVRLIRIGADVDLQPCGGTHVSRTGEIGKIEIAKIENKGRQNRRVRIRLSDAN